MTPSTNSAPTGRQSGRQSGFSLVELMVALVAGLVVSTAVVAFAMSSMKSNSDYVQGTRLTQELRNTMDLVTRELRRSGYDQKALALIATGTASPFSRLKLDRSVTVGADTFYTCVIYSYDRGVGNMGARDPDEGEIRAIRWYSRTVNGDPIGVMEFAQSSSSGSPVCDGDSPDYTKYPPACNSTSHWCALSDPRLLDITEFHITDGRTNVGSGVNVVQLRDLGLSMSGRIAGTTDTTRTVESTVRVRTDCYDSTITNCSNTPAP